MWDLSNPRKAKGYHLQKSVQKSDTTDEDSSDSNRRIFGSASYDES